IIVYAGGNTIGGTAPGQGNVISGNGPGNVISGSDFPLNNTGFPHGGVALLGFNNVVEGNLIGLTADGNAALGNADYGIDVLTGDNVIGGPSPGARNVVAGSRDSVGILVNGFFGVQGAVIQGNYIGTNADGDAALGNGDGVYLLGGPT